MAKILNDQYAIKDLLKKTDFFSIYSGMNVNTEEYVFIKELTDTFPNLIVKTNVTEQFKAEVKIYFKGHKNLAKFKDYFDFENFRYLVVDYIEGSTLRELMGENDGILDPQLVFALGIKLCEVLQYFHNFKPKPIVFNKLSPDDIFLLSDDDIKIFDLGLSRVNDGKRFIELPDDEYSFFISPERYSGDITTVNDVYSLGAVLYYLLTGSTVLKANFNDDVPLYLQRIIRKAMSLLREDRYQNIKDMKHDLEKACVAIYGGEDKGDYIFLKEEEEERLEPSRKTIPSARPMRFSPEAGHQDRIASAQKTIASTRPLRLPGEGQEQDFSSRQKTIASTRPLRLPGESQEQDMATSGEKTIASNRSLRMPSEGIEKKSSGQLPSGHLKPLRIPPEGIEKKSSGQLSSGHLKPPAEPAEPQRRTSIQRPIPSARHLRLAPSTIENERNGQKPSIPQSLPVKPASSQEDIDTKSKTHKLPSGNVQQKHFVSGSDLLKDKLSVPRRSDSTDELEKDIEFETGDVPEDKDFKSKLNRLRQTREYRKTPTLVLENDPAVILRGQYKILEVINVNPLTKTYKGMDIKTGNLILIKELIDRGDIAAKQQAINQFKIEAKILFGLNHPSLPRYNDYFDFNDTRYLVMEYVQGEILENIIEAYDDFVDEIQVIEWGLQICDVLSYLHNRKPDPIIFRNLKPDNIVLTDDGKLKLTDFGISKLFQKNQHTLDVAKIFNPHFSPIEQYSGNTDERTDIYSLGAILYYAITKTKPLPAIDIISGEETLRPCHSFNKSVSADFDEAILKAMGEEKEARFSSVGEFKKILEEILANVHGL